MRNLLASREERVFFKDLQSRFILVSQGWLDALGGGRTLEDVIGRTDFDFFSDPHALAAYEDEQRVIETGEPIVGKVERETFEDRADLWVSTTKLPLRDRRGRIIGTFGVSRDVTAQIEAQRALEYQALHDSVTGLLNRVALTDRLGQSIAGLDRHPGRFAVLFLDIDQFKAINDTLGHDVGDQVLVEISHRLRRVARRADTIARYGGDEFVLLCGSLNEDEDVLAIAERVISAVSMPIELENHTFGISCSIGAVACADPSADPSELLERADLAMYEAKRAGTNQSRLYETGLRRDRAVAGVGSLAGDLRRALASEDELFVLYQPVFRLADKVPISLEALVRWRHPERGLIPPSEFVPVAEQQGLISPLDNFVLGEALRQLAGWRQDEGCPPELTVAVNVASRELRDRDLPARLAATLDRHGVPPEALCLEISENAMLAELEDIDGVLGAVVDLGVSIALDDFGTGYSTLAHAQHLRPHVLKIDRRFVANVASHRRDRDIVAAMIAMAHALDMTVVGEGVETDLQRSELVALGCDAVQGFLFAGPMPPEAIAELWAARRRTAAAAAAGWGAAAQAA
jgi:diguanylate cyclase (GGDEF)-like protein/PAS domain S-box-containing protein